MSTTELSAAKRRLLEKLRRGEGGGPDRDSDPLLPRPAGTPAPLSPDQRQVWLHAAMAPGLPLYNEPITIHRGGSFDLAVLERAFNEILRRHEIWRTAFEAADGGVFQSVRQDLQIRLPVVDLTGLPAAAREAEALRIATEDARLPFDLGAAPLFRAQVLKLAEDDHRLHLTLHHIIFDGVSIYRILLPELSALYAAYAAGQPSPLAERALHYGDYTLWRERRAVSEPVNRQLDYWRRQLAGELPVLRLPTDHPRPSMLTYRGSMETFTLPPELTATLRALSRTEGATFYMTLLAAFKAMLYRYSGQEDILIGGVTDTRRRPELEGLMGYFLNSFVLRTQPNAALPFRAYLTQVRNTVLGALDASEVPFDRLIRELQPKRDPSCHPLFQVLFSMEPPAEAFAGGWDLTQMDVTIGAAKFDLYLELDERPEGVIGRFLYSTDLFEAPTIRRMIGHWVTLLEGVAADPDCPLGRLPLLTAAESQELLVGWNATRRAAPAAVLHELIEVQAQRTPQAIAAEFEGQSWTYAELDRQATRLAARLRQAGVGRETLVGIAVERSLDMMAGLLAILKAGGTYLPLDPAFPRQRLSLIIEDAKPAVLLTHGSLLPKLPQPGCRILFFDRDLEAEEGAADAPHDGAGPETLAYVLYTSGSTGKPKGVEVPHRAVVNLLAAMQRQPGFAARDALLAVTTLSFDIAALELFLPLVSGGRVVIASRDVASDPLRLAELIRSSRCTVMQATPATWRGLIDAGWGGDPELKILCGGEALPRDLAEKLLTRSASLWNMYGPTETTIWSTLHRVVHGTGPVPIGRPIANTLTYILDGGGFAVPVGVAGELYIGGAGVARGYKGRAELTRERFVELPVAAGERLYRTGDLARYGADGIIDCLGRTDNQLKIRGFRIELGEIEAAIESLPGIAAAAVKPWVDAAGEKSLTAYLVATAERLPPSAELRRLLRQILPEYMLPARFVALPALPLTPNGKLDRNALTEPTGETAVARFVPPEGEPEQKLAAIWQEILGVPRVGRQDSFFDLGGHSLLVAKLLRRIEAGFGQRLPMAAVFHAPTIEQLARLLNDAGAVAQLPRAVEIQPRGWRPPLFWLNAGPKFRPLAEAIGLDQPFLGLALDEAEEREIHHPATFGEIARYLVRAVRAAQPRGPYYLGGWCTAGILAYEVAAQLTVAGQEVRLVVLAHATNPVHFRRMGSLAIERSKLVHHWRQSLRRRGFERWSYAAGHVADAMGRLADSGRRATVTRNELPFLEILEQAAYHYEPPLYPGDVVLFQPADRPSILDYRPGWANVVMGSFTAYDIPGDHRSMLEQPCVQELAERMRDCLVRAQSGERDERRAAN